MTVSNEHAAARRRGRACRDEMARQLILIDLDNVTGMRDLNVSDWRHLMDALRDALAVSTGDELIISMCRRTMDQAMVALATTPGRLLVKDGPDGAELAIADLLDIAHASIRFSSLVVVSGDGFFVDLTRTAHDHGMRVRQVCSNRAGCSKRLRRAVDSHLTLNIDKLLAEQQREARRTYALAS